MKHIEYKGRIIGKCRQNTDIKIIINIPDTLLNF